MKIKLKAVSVVAVAICLGVGSFFLAPSDAKAQVGPICEFTRNLGVGSVGEDVRCLQRFLNVQGFILAVVGPGSVGYETTYFGNLTRSALIRWQTARGVNPITGVLDFNTRTLYTQTVSNQGNNPPVVSTSALAARTAILSSLSSVKNALSDIDDSNASNSAIDDASDDVLLAIQNLMSAVTAFTVSHDYAKAISLADNAEDLAVHAQNTLEDDDNDNDNDVDEEEEAEDAINDAEESINDAQDDVDAAEDDGDVDQDDIDEANDLLDEARDVLDEAEEAFDDEDWDEVMDLTDEVQDLVDEAMDLI